MLAAQFFSNVGNWMEAFAIQIFVAKATGRLDDQGVLAALQSLPIFLFGLLGGVVADRVDRRLLLVVTQVLAGVVAVGVVIVSTIQFADPRSAVHWLFFLGAVHGTVMAFNFPAWQVLTPRLVPKPELTKAITLNGIQFNLARVVGPALAGAFLVKFASTPLFIFNAVSFFLMAGVIMTTPRAPALPRTGERVWRQIREAAAYVIEDRGARAVVFAQFILSLLAAPLVRLLSLYGIDVYHLGQKDAEWAVGILLAVQGVGAVIGGFALRLIPKWYPKHHFIPVAVSAVGGSIVIFALTTSVYAGYAAMLIVGFFWIWGFNQSWAAIQVLAPDRMRGRVLSVVTVASFGSTAVGVFVAGKVGEWLKAQTFAPVTAGQATQIVIAGLGFPLLVAGVYMLLNRTPEIDGMPRAIRGQRGSLSLYRALVAAEHSPKRRRESTMTPPEETSDSTT